jgi:hypothetical protein
MKGFAKILGVALVGAALAQTDNMHDMPGMTMSSSSGPGPAISPSITIASAHMEASSPSIIETSNATHTAILTAMDMVPTQMTMPHVGTNSATVATTTGIAVSAGYHSVVIVGLVP